METASIAKRTPPPNEPKLTGQPGSVAFYMNANMVEPGLFTKLFPDCPDCHRKLRGELVIIMGRVHHLSCAKRAGYKVEGGSE